MSFSFMTLLIWDHCSGVGSTPANAHTPLTVHVRGKRDGCGMRTQRSTHESDENKKHSMSSCWGH